MARSKQYVQKPDETDEGGPSGPRFLWSGTISFGLVSVPVGLVPAVKSARLPLRMLGPDGQPLRRQYICSKEEKPLSSDEIVRGYDVGDELVPIEEEELEKLAPDRTRAIQLERFVPRDELSPLLFERGYFLVPAAEGTRAYQLLREAMADSDRVGIATFVMRGKEYLVAILAEGGLLRLETLRYQDELVSPKDVGIETPKSVPAKTTEAMRELIRKQKKARLPTELLVDLTQAELRALVDKKWKQHEDVVEAPAGEDGSAEAGDNVIDLMEYLKKSLGQAPARTRASSKTRKAPRKTRQRKH